MGFIAGMMLPYDKAEEAKRTAESDARMIEKAASSAQAANSRTDSEVATSGEAELQHATEETTAESDVIENPLRSLLLQRMKVKKSSLS